MSAIPFNKPYLTGDEIEYILDAHSNGKLAGDGKYTALASSLVEDITRSEKALITHSCTAALEMIAILLDLTEGDEVIMPSFTFVSTANAFVLRGATPVFVDIDSQSLNIDPSAIRAAITKKTKAIVVVHYAGVCCDMDAVLAIGQEYGIIVIEDAAQAFMSTYKRRQLGSLGVMAALSFHETKNIISGEGGALLLNDQTYASRAEVIREKGTNRSRFFRGETDKYTWVDIGSSFLPGELVTAFLYAQLQSSADILSKRKKIWARYHDGFAELEHRDLVRRHFIPEYCNHNAHMYYLILKSPEERQRLIEHLRGCGIQAVFHYIPLHSSPAGIRYGKTSGTLKHTDLVSERILRFPMGCDVNVHRVVSETMRFFGK